MSLVRDPAVLPVRPGVRGEEERGGERDDLHADGEREHDRERGACATSQEPEPSEVCHEGADQQDEEERLAAAAAATRVTRHERRVLEPRERAGRRDQDEHGQPGERGAAAQGSMLGDCPDVTVVASAGAVATAGVAAPFGFFRFRPGGVGASVVVSVVVVSVVVV